MTKDIYLFSEENLLAQLTAENYLLGFYKVKFNANNGILSAAGDGKLEEFYLFPSAGALRDKEFNIILYNSHFDIYRGFHLPHLV